MNNIDPSTAVVGKRKCDMHDGGQVVVFRSSSLHVKKYNASFALLTDRNEFVLSALP